MIGRLFRRMGWELDKLIDWRSLSVPDGNSGVPLEPAKGCGVGAVEKEEEPVQDQRRAERDLALVRLDEEGDKNAQRSREDEDNRQEIPRPFSARLHSYFLKKIKEDNIFMKSHRSPVKFGVTIIHYVTRKNTTRQSIY